MPGTSHQPAIYSIAWATVSSWYYGYHLSELNFPVASLTCLSPALPAPSRLPLCLGLDTYRYGLVTAIFTAGGLVGSLMSSYVVQHEGIKGGIAWTGYLNLIGVIAMAMAPTWIILAVGRFLVGVACGVGICLVPPFLAMLAKSSPDLSHRSGQIGTLHQLAIVIGLFSAQVAGWILTGSQGDKPGNWRYVVFISGIASAVQIYFSGRVFTPAGERDDTKPSDHAGLDEEGRLAVLEEEEAVEGGNGSTPATPLLAGQHGASAGSPHHGGGGGGGGESQIPVRDLISNTALRGPALLGAAIMCLQQFSGVNAVLFYSTPVLRNLMPASAGLIGIFITLVNVVMTFAPILLVDRLGRKRLLLISVVWMGSMAALLAYALDEHHQRLSAFAIVSFIAAFSVGLGPIPFLLISELVPAPAVPALSSLALSLSWIANFFIAMLFLPLRDALSSPIDPSDPMSDKLGEGRVFYVFTMVCGVLAVLVWRGLSDHRP